MKRLAVIAATVLALFAAIPGPARAATAQNGRISNAAGYCLAAADGRAWLVPCTLHARNLDFWRPPGHHRVETPAGLCLTRGAARALLVRRCDGAVSQRWSWAGEGRIASPYGSCASQTDRGYPVMRRCGNSPAQYWLFLPGR